MNPHIFREFSIRGIADQDLPDDVVAAIGQAIGEFFRQRGGTFLVVGRDIRNSSHRISQSLVTGLVQAGIYVTDVGIVPTPVHNFATDFYTADGGIMSTASHNPPEYNGFKIRTDDTLHGKDLQTIYHIASKFLQSAKSPAEAEALLDQHSISTDLIKQANPLSAYLERVKAHANIPVNRTLKVVVDGGNGTNGPIVSQLLQELGCDVVELFCEPDGNFPNRVPDPTASGAVEHLAASVLREKADLGLAYDGDGDRLVLVDEQGNTVMGDQILMILARDVLRHGPAKIVYEILCTQALADDVIAHGGEPVMTPSGYAFAHQAMRKTGAALGGELSGHLFFSEPDFRFDDAILGTVKLLNVISQSHRSLSDLVGDLPTYHSSPELRVPCPDEAKTSVVEQVKTQFKDEYQVETLDGARVNFGDGWALVRPSNTQPVISMRFEALSAERLEAIQSRVYPLVEAEIRRHTDPGTTL